METGLLIRWLRVLIALPGTVLLVIPLVLLRLTRGPRWLEVAAGPEDAWFWVAMSAGILGAFWSAWSVAMFMRFGGGTAAPWDPPRRFVVRGPYRHLRNPMILGIFLMLLCEALVFRSWAVASWLGGFVIGNLVYIPVFEEKGLEKRFGADYVTYRRHVPRWIPRPRGWPPRGGANDRSLGSERSG